MWTGTLYGNLVSYNNFQRRALLTRRYKIQANTFTNLRTTNGNSSVEQRSNSRTFLLVGDFQYKEKIDGKCKKKSRSKIIYRQAFQQRYHRYTNVRNIDKTLKDVNVQQTWKKKIRKNKVQYLLTAMRKQNIVSISMYCSTSISSARFTHIQFLVSIIQKWHY